MVLFHFFLQLKKAHDFEYAGAALRFQIDGAKTFFSAQNRKDSFECCSFGRSQITLSP